MNGHQKPPAARTSPGEDVSADLLEKFLKAEGCRGIRFISLPDEPGAEGVVYFSDPTHRDAVSQRLARHPNVAWVAPPSDLASVMPFRICGGAS